tara:strand:- start:141 stop:302 length:162 start_codon:yes stop_codon:yes gene_type:complete
MDFQNKRVIVTGGLGTRLSEYTKAMVEIKKQNRPEDLRSGLESFKANNGSVDY